MFDFIFKVFSTKSEKDLKLLFPYVDEINNNFNNLSFLSNDDLRKKVLLLKEDLSFKLKNLSLEIFNLKKEINNNKYLSFLKGSNLFDDLDESKKKYNKLLNKSLDNILPFVFAILKETTRRFKNNNSIVVNAEKYDIEIASKFDYVTIKGEKAIWSNEWKVFENTVIWDMIYYDVQLIGGIILHQGKITEMSTGEGKTLVATLPAFLNAIGGKNVHIVTVNNYLSCRDFQWMRPIYEFYGLKVDCIDNYLPNSIGRKKSYLSNILYGTNNEFGFDYLRDNMAMSLDDLVQIGHDFAIIDEVDSVLIDDSRTPLIISGPIESNNDYYYNLNNLVKKLFCDQKKIVNFFLQKSKKNIFLNNRVDAGISIFRSYRGLPKDKNLIKFLSSFGVKQLLYDIEKYYLQDSLKMMDEIDFPLLFTVDEKSNSIDLTDKGMDYIINKENDLEFFILNDINLEISTIENNFTFTNNEKIKNIKIVKKKYIDKINKIHIIDQLLKSYVFFEKNVDYIVDSGVVKIVDEQTGRILDGRRYSNGLHQAIEAKEFVKIENSTQVYASITLQNYFRMYEKLSGMTGTAETESEEFFELYGLDVVIAPTNKPNIRDDKADKIFKTIKEKFDYILREIIDLSNEKRPILVGTTSIESSELISKMLSLKKVNHRVLNAKQHKKEANIISSAGFEGLITIATNMAGRGTDIKLSKNSRLNGGLAVIGTERHESRRIDNQLRGRSGRQGDVGSSQFFISLEDNLMRLFGSDKIAGLMDKIGLKEGDVIQHSIVNKSIERAQKKIEENNFFTRRRLLDYDNVVNYQRKFIYQRRKNSLFSEKLYFDILYIIFDISDFILFKKKKKVNYSYFKSSMLSYFKILTKIKLSSFLKNSNFSLVNKVHSEILFSYDRKKKSIQEKIWPKILYFFKQNKVLGHVNFPIYSGNIQFNLILNIEKCLNSSGLYLLNFIETFISLKIIDKYWRDHLVKIDSLKESVQSAVYEQKDPLLVYKFEAFEVFNNLVLKINLDIISFLLKYYISVNNNELNSFNFIVDKVLNRNHKVNVEYKNGIIKNNVKFKLVEDDINKNKCVIID